ncbi:MAG: hypothetical protein ABFR65_09020 [Pseudomonadota bacterium]
MMKHLGQRYGSISIDTDPIERNHIWTVPVPSDLAEGVCRVKVDTVDVHGYAYSESLLFEVRTPNESIDPIDNDPTDEKYDRRLPSEL